MAEELVGSVSWPVFVGLTLVMFGWLAFMAATALARMWRPWWSNIAYGLILGVGNRILEMMLYDGRLLSLRGYLVDTAYIVAVMLLFYRGALARRMVQQYPWLYERAGPFGWRERASGSR
jgi:branched-chain amino acid transport system ATP-binding protein